MTNEKNDEPLAVLGGTGKEGRGLALRLTRAGLSVVIGSRDAARGAEAAEAMRASQPDLGVTGTSNEEAVRICGKVISTLPHPGDMDILEPLREALEGKLLITASIAWPPALDGKPSAAELLQQKLGDSVRVAAAFQTVSAKTLALEAGTTEPEDVLVFGDDETTREEACRLVAATGLRPIDAGPLEGVRVAEAVTGLLLRINKRYGVKRSGLRLTGIET